MALDPYFVERMNAHKIDIEELERLASARDAVLQRQPKWEKSKALIYSKDGVVARAHQTFPQRNVAKYVDEGLTKTARVGYCPYARMIDPAGNVCSLPIGNHRLPPRKTDGYSAAIVEWKIKDGWLKFDDVPQNAGLYSRSMEEWRLEREHVIRHRKAEQGRRSATFNEIYKSQEERVMEQVAAATAAPIQTLVNSMAEMMARGQKAAK